MVGPNGELSRGFRALIAILVDRLSAEAVRVWRLEGEAGAREQTKSSISFIVRRRVAGATMRGIAAHVVNRVWWVNGAPRVPSNGDGPREGFAAGARERGDRFDDPYSHIAGRGDWRGNDFDSRQL